MNSNIIQLKRGKKETWEKLNPILAYGEPGFVKETGELKIGDGVTAWNNLQNISKESIPYINGNNASPPLILMDLKPGPYVLTGTFAYSNNPENGQIPFTNTLVQIDEIGEDQKSVSFQVADEIICIFFTNDSYEYKRYWLADLGNSSDSAEGVVLYIPQTLTDEEKAQARKNIGAAYVNPDGGIFEIEDDAGGVSIFMKADETDEYELLLFGGADRGYVRICGVADGKYSGDVATVGQLQSAIRTIHFERDDNFIGDYDGETREGFITRDLTRTQMLKILQGGGVLVGAFDSAYTAVGCMDDGWFNDSGSTEIKFGVFSHIFDDRLIRNGGGQGNELWISSPLD